MDFYCESQYIPQYFIDKTIHVCLVLLRAFLIYKIFLQFILQVCDLTPQLAILNLPNIYCNLLEKLTFR